MFKSLWFHGHSFYYFYCKFTAGLKVLRIHF